MPANQTNIQHAAQREISLALFLCAAPYAVLAHDLAYCCFDSPAKLLRVCTVAPTALAVASSRPTQPLLQSVVGLIRPALTGALQVGASELTASYERATDAAAGAGQSQPTYAAPRSTRSLVLTFLCRAGCLAPCARDLRTYCQCRSSQPTHARTAAA